MTSIRKLALLCLVTALGGCASNLPVRHVPSDKNSILLTDASSVLTVTRSTNGGLVTCSRMNSDVSVARTASLSVSTLNFGDDADSSGEEETELQGRTPGLLAMRDALFHSCILYQSGAITSGDLLQMTQSILARSYDVLEIEAGNSQWIFNEQASFSGASGLAVQPAATTPSSVTTVTTPSSDTTTTTSSSDAASSGDFADFN